MSSSFVEPQLEGLLRATIADNSVELHLPILHGVPHLARTGDADQVVHSFWARRAARLLHTPGMPRDDSVDTMTKRNTSQLSELRGKEHWWWDTVRENDGGALNDAEMRGFFDAALGGAPRGSRPHLPPLPAHMTLVSHSPGTYAGRAGWRILQSHLPGRMSSVQLHQRPSGGSDFVALELRTRNVRRLLAPRNALVNASIELRIDGGAPLRVGSGDSGGGHGGEGGREADGEEGSVELCHRSVGLPTASADAGWGPCPPQSWQEAERGPAGAGPLRQAMQHPFTIVYGGGDNGGGSELERLGVYLANLFVLTSHASPALLPDVAVDESLKAAVAVAVGRVGGAPSSKTDNVSMVAAASVYGNLLLLGGPRANAASAALARYWAAVGHAASWSTVHMQRRQPVSPSPSPSSRVECAECNLSPDARLCLPLPAGWGALDWQLRARRSCRCGCTRARPTSGRRPGDYH